MFNRVTKNKNKLESLNKRREKQIQEEEGNEIQDDGTVWKKYVNKSLPSMYMVFP